MAPRKPGLTAAKKREFLALLSEGFSRTRAAQQCGVTIRTVREAMAADEEFGEAVEHIESFRDDEVVEALHRTAIKGNVEAQKFWLTNRVRQEWANRQTHEHSGPGGGPIAVAAAATLALQNVLMGDETRERALGFIDTELVPSPRTLGALEEGGDSGELGDVRIEGGMGASRPPHADQPDGGGGSD